MRKLLFVIFGLVIFCQDVFGQVSDGALYQKVDALSTYQVSVMRSTLDSLIKSKASLLKLTATDFNVAADGTVTIDYTNGAQQKLVSGTNIKTVNGNTLLGSGDLSISSGVTGSGTTGQLASWSSSSALTATTSLPSGTTATTQSAFDNSTKVSTTAYADRKVDKVKRTLGTLFDNTGAFSSGNYTQNGTTFTVNATTISGNSGGVAGTYTNNISYNYITLLHNYVLEATYTLGTVGAASTGLGFGIKGTGLGTKVDYVVTYNTTSGASAGKITVHSILNGSATLVSTSTGAVAPSTGDQVRVRIVVGRGKMSVEFMNVTQNRAISIAQLGRGGVATYNDAVYGIAGTSTIGKPCIWNLGFQGTVTSFKFTSNEIVGADFLVVGNSIANGSYAEDVGGTWADRLARDLNADVVVHAGSSLVSADYLDLLTEAIALAPQNVILHVGTNDIAGVASQSIAILETNLPTIITAFQNAGINVYLPEILPRNLANVSVHNTWLWTNYSSLTIPIFQAFTDGVSNGSLTTTYSIDNLHLNEGGHALFANLIEQKLAAGYTKRINERPLLPATFPANTIGNNLGRKLFLGTLDNFNVNFIANGMTGNGRFEFGPSDGSINGFVNFVTNNSGASGLSRIYFKNTHASGYSEFFLIDQSNASTGSLQLDNSTKEVYVSALTGAALLHLRSSNNLKVSLGSSLTQSGNWTTTGLFIGGSTTPTAKLHLAASTTASSTGQIKLAEGSRQTSAEDGTINYVSNNIEFVEGSTVYNLAKTLTATGSLNFDLTSVNTQDLTITVTGAADGDPVSLAVPAASATANVTFTAWVSATNTVTVRAARVDVASGADPASGTFRASVIHY